MAGERDLDRLLLGLRPTLIAGEFVFMSFSESHYGDHSELEPIASMMEDEGLTLVVPRAKADERKLRYESVFSCITLSIHSSLDAVGLTAAFSGILAEQGISANVVAGYHHDHIFVPASLVEKALSAINRLSR